MYHESHADNDNVVEGITRQLGMYLDCARQLTAMLDQENQLLLFEHTETLALRDSAHQDMKHTLYKRVETLARIVTRSIEAGDSDALEVLQEAIEPIEDFKRSLRLNSVMLEVSMDRQERRMRKLMEMVETRISSAENARRGTSQIAEAQGGV